MLRHTHMPRPNEKSASFCCAQELAEGFLACIRWRILACACDFLLCTAHVGVKAVWHQALKSLLFASRAVPMTMKIVAAAAGAIAFQALGGLFASPARAAWGWFMDVPTGLGFTCSEGTSLGCASPAGCEDSNFTCTVVPDAGMSCDCHFHERRLLHSRRCPELRAGLGQSDVCPGQHKRPLQQRQPVLEHGPDLRHNHQYHRRCVDVGCKHGGGRICCGGPGNSTAALRARECIFMAGL